jgi:hypothetical protein
MTEVKLSNPKGMAQRIADRLKPSNDLANADIHVVKGTGPTRTHTAIHHSANHTHAVTPPMPKDGERR